MAQPTMSGLDYDLMGSGEVELKLEAVRKFATARGTERG